MSSAPKYMVTTSVKGRKRNQVWSSDQPMPLGYRFDWILENTEAGPQLRCLTGPTQKVESDSSFKIDQETIDKSFMIELPDNVSLKLKKLRPVPPAYLSPPASPDRRSADYEKGTPQLVAFNGKGRASLGSQPVHAAYVAYSRSRPVFTVQSSPEGYKIKPLLNGVRLKLKGQKSLQGQVGETWKLDHDQLMTATIVRNSGWWRFNLVPAVAALPDEASGDSWWDQENLSYRRMIIGIGALLLLAFLVIGFWPVQTKVKEEPPETPVVKFVAPKNKSAPKPAPAPVAHVQAPEAPPAPEPPKPKAPPKPAEPVAKAAPAPAPKAAPVAAPKAAPPAAPKPDPRKAQQAQAAAKMAALREAFGGAMDLSKKSVTGKANQGPNNASGIFNPSGASLTPTDIKPGYAGGNVKVGTLGGGAGGGVGYASGERAAAAKGGGFVSVDAGGASVDEGLSRDEVGAVIHKHMDEIRYCQDSAMLYRPNLEGKLVVDFSIDPNGRVERAAAKSSDLPDKVLEDCILKKLVHWQFPKPRGGKHVGINYPFIFKALGRE